MDRRMLPVALALVAALALVPTTTRAQISPGIHAARAADVFGGANGLGASLELGIPLLPIDAFVAGEYFFPDCGSGSGCSFAGGSADLHFELPFPVLSPYATAGLVYRRYDEGDSAKPETHSGFGAGAGVNLGGVVLGAYAEARYEFVDPDNQLVFRIGIRF